MPAYQSMLQPDSWRLGSSWSRRKAGPQTWAPMSPPVGVVSIEDEVGARVDRVQVDDVHHHDGRDDERERGDEEPHDPIGRPRSLGPADGTSEDAPTGAGGPRAPLGCRRGGVASSSTSGTSAGSAAAPRSPPPTAPRAPSNQHAPSQIDRSLVDSRGSHPSRRPIMPASSAVLRRSLAVPAAGRSR